MNLRELSLRSKVILGYVGLSLFYALIIGLLLKDWFVGLPYFIQFLIGSFPIFGLFSIILGGINKPKRILGSFLLFITADIIAVPFMVSPDGSFGNAFLSEASSDVFIANLAQALGFNGFMLYLMTYVVITSILVTIAVYLLKNKDLKDEFD